MQDEAYPGPLKKGYVNMLYLHTETRHETLVIPACF